MTIYRLDALLSQFWTSPLFHVQFCCFLTCIQVSQGAGQLVLYSISWRIFHRLIHTVTGFSVVSEAEVDIFLELSCFFCDPTDVGNFISGSSAFSKSSLYIWKFSVHVLLKPSLKDFEHYLASMWREINCGSLLLWIKPKPSCTSFSVDTVFIFLGYVSRSGIAGSHDNSLFCFVRNWQNVLQGEYLLTMYVSFSFLHILISICFFGFWL